MRKLILSLCLLLAAGLAPSASAQYGQGFVRPPSISQDDLRRPIQPLKSRQQAIDEALQRYGGEVLSVRVRGADQNDPFYEIRLIAKGQVRVVRIDARAR